jgi:SpoU rRNA methylase family enzyme
LQVLVLARESVLAALIGMLLELEDYEPVFAQPDERPEDAISRLRPALVVMLDGEHACAHSDLFFVRAAAAGARLVLFSEPVAAAAVRGIAQQRRLPYLAMPVDRVTLRGVLDRVAVG